jgi:hypothetical protein
MYDWLSFKWCPSCDRLKKAWITAHMNYHGGDLIHSRGVESRINRRDAGDRMGDRLSVVKMPCEITV